jgi:hypothetical protein
MTSEYCIKELNLQTLMWLSNSKLNARVEFWKSVHQVVACIRWWGTVMESTVNRTPFLKAVNIFRGVFLTILTAVYMV